MTSPSVDPTNLLLGLAWLGALDRLQIQRLWFADKSESTVEKTLARLRKDGLIARRSWSLRDPQRNVTASQLARWSLTPAGHLLVRSSDQYPAKPATVRQQRLVAHDARTAEAVVRLIEIGRAAGLSGVFVAHELQLHPRERRPACDALVALQLGAFDAPNLVPWMRSPASDRPDEHRLRFAIEADNHTEPLTVIAAKAAAYRRLTDDADWRIWWVQRYGPVPIPLWIAPSEARAMAIHAEWKRAWPTGAWLVTSDDGLAANRWTEWRARSEQATTLRFVAPRPAPPPPRPAALPALPTAPAAAPAVQTPGAAAPAVSGPPPPPIRPAVSPAPPPAGRPSELLPSYPPQPRSAAGATEQRQPTNDSSSWRHTAWALLRGGAWLLWALLKVLWAIVMLPWHILSALWRWYENLDSETVSIAWRIGLAIVLVAVPLSLWLAPPAWLHDALNQLAASAQADVPPEPAEGALEAVPHTPACPSARVTATRVNLRAGPGLSHPVLRKLRQHEALTVLDCTGVAHDQYVWWQVADGDGSVGWVVSKWLEARPGQ